MVTFRSFCARPLAMFDPQARIFESPSPTVPPSTFRLATTRSVPSALMASSMAGNRVSSCCRSASMTATKGAEDDRMPSMQAPESPLRPMRRMTRTRGSVAARPRATSVVPSGELSSTTIASQATPASALSSSSIRGGMFLASLKLGSTTLNSATCAPDDCRGSSQPSSSVPCAILAALSMFQPCRPVRLHCWDLEGFASFRICADHSPASVKYKQRDGASLRQPDFPRLFAKVPRV